MGLSAILHYFTRISALPLKELQEVLSYPYDEQSQEVEDKYYRLRPSAFSDVGGVSYYSCSS